MTGLVGNTLVLLVLRRDGLVRTSANVYLSALAVGDSLVLMVALIVWYLVLAWGWWLVDASTLAGYAARPVRDFAFPDTNFVKALLAMRPALRLVAGSKHARRAFGSATWQAGASSGQGRHKTKQNKNFPTYIKTSRAVFLPHIRSLESR